VQADRPTHGYDGPIKVSSGGRKMSISEDFIRVGSKYHKRPFSDDSNDLETCNTYSVRHLMFIIRLLPLTKFLSAMVQVSICS
jgi:hypothetical protein